MGKIIVFWTPYKEYGQNTCIMASVAGGLGIIDEQNVAVTSLPGRKSRFFEDFDVRVPEKIRSGQDESYGFKAVIQRALFEKPEADDFEKAGIRTINKGPLLFPWFKDTEDADAEKNAVTLIMGAMKDCFDYVLVDAYEGEKSGYSELLVKNANVVVITMPHDKRRWRDYFNEDIMTVSGKVIYALTPFWQDSAYGESYFAGAYKGVQHYTVYGFHPSAAFLDACTEGRAAEYFLDSKVGKKSRDKAFFAEVKRITEEIKSK